MEKEISKSQLKKLSKKSSRLEANLTQKKGFLFSSKPSLILLLGNAGLRNDVTRGLLEQSIINVNYIELIMPPEETFSFLLFDSLIQAQKARTVLTGFSLETPDIPLRTNVVVYPLFISDSCYLNLDSLGGVNLEKEELPPGLQLTHNVVPETESQLLQSSVLCDNDDSETDTSSALKQRRVLHFGYEFLYGKNTVDPNAPLLSRPFPTACIALVDRLLASKLITSRPDQLTVNVYEPGHGIPPHVDTHSAFWEELVSVSLGSASVMQFNKSNIETRTVFLPAGSLLVMRGEARYLWSHCIPARKWDLLRDSEGRWSKHLRTRRVSLTLRTLRIPQICKCIWPEQCDTAISQKKASNHVDNVQSGKGSPAVLDDPISLERLHVHEVYEQIADHFSDTRHSVWPSVERFLLSLPAGSLVVDAGCGNGKYLAVNASLLPILACDRSWNLCDICHQRGHDAVQADLLSLPYRSNQADFAICIAVLHHLSSPERRHSALLELARVLRPGGRLLLHVWALEQDWKGQPANYLKSSGAVTTSDDEAKDLEEKSTVLPVHVNRTRFKDRDMLVPWHHNKKKDGDGVFHRYYHLFSEGELEEICEQTGLFKPVESYYDKGNWSLIVEKL